MILCRSLFIVALLCYVFAAENTLGEKLKWDKLVGKDSPHEDIKNSGTKVVSELKSICGKIEYCCGFNENGFLKYNCSTIVEQSTTNFWLKDPAPPKPVWPPFNVWPNPASWKAGSTSLLVKSEHRPSFFKSDSTSDILKQAMTRYTSIVFSAINVTEDAIPTQQVDGDADRVIPGFDIKVFIDDENLQLGTDESYTLEIPDTGARGKVAAVTVFGALKALETIAQLIEFEWSGLMQIKNTPLVISDKPRHAHRGLLVDSSRHFLPMNVILKAIDGLSYNKMNVMHWHLSDDQSFSYESKVAPLLSEKGSFNPKRAVYSRADIAKVIKYGLYRGVRVMPEFDMPAHTASWMKGYPFLQGNANCGMDPTLDSTYAFVEKFLQEQATTFPDNYLHLGGDELSFSCWDTDPIKKWMKENNIPDTKKLEAYFEAKILAIAAKFNISVMIWQDVFNNGVKVAPQTVVQVWRYNDYKTLKEVVAAGYQAVMSAFWYLDHLGDTWETFYESFISMADLTPAESELVMGGEACMWGEWVDYTNFEPRVWPRASAVAEVLWSPAHFPRIPSKAAKRLHSWKCRMNRRGLNADPVSTIYHVSFCDPL